MDKDKAEYLRLKQHYELRGYKVFFERGTLGRGWNLMHSPNVTAPTWKRQITWFNINPLL